MAKKTAKKKVNEMPMMPKGKMMMKESEMMMKPKMKTEKKKKK